ncbi:MAG: hypothetical protein HUU20_12325 [Pirellulales bacterium]|nr:hypothetical protein [Pirellulales bacterium]
MRWEVWQATLGVIVGLSVWAGDSDRALSAGPPATPFVEDETLDATGSPRLEVAPARMPLNVSVEEPSAVEFDGPLILSPDGEETILEEPIWEPLVVEEYPGEFLDSECAPRKPVWFRNLSIAAGVHGFKGPSDFGQSGNFGFDEGLNWGAPVPFVQNLPFCSGLGFQLGVRGVHGNYSGNQATWAFDGFSSDRDQFFFTAATFTRRLERGWQTGGAFDYFHDNYYDDTDLKQARTEFAYVFDGRHELGFWGAYGAGSDQVTFTIVHKLVTSLEPNDVYTLFYRRRFTGGGQGRIWGGVTGDGDVVLGADGTVPLGTNWSLQNNFTYLIPKEGRGFGAETQESWAVSIRLVWYPGQLSRCVFKDRFQPLFDVADNGVFLVERGPTTLAP